VTVAARLRSIVSAGAAALWCAFFAAAAGAQALPPARDVAYLGPLTLQVDATDVDHKLLQIVETIPVRPGRLVLLYPQWIPGNHSPSNEVKRLAGLRISAGAKVLPWQRDPAHFHAFVVDVPAGVGALELRFQQILPIENGGDNPLLTRLFADVQWQGAVLYPAGHDVSRIDVDASLRVPKGWAHASALRAQSEDVGLIRFQRVSLETLIDSPVFAGKHFRRFELDAGGERPVALDVFAEEAESLEATPEQIELHRNLVRQADRLFGARHFAHYDILLALGDSVRGLGLEHQQSSENGAKDGYFTEWKKMFPARYIVPHEFTHSWNGKFRRPRDLWAADFNAPTRNSLLWVYEGQTQYWGDVLAARAGLYEPQEARDRLAIIAAIAEANPGRGWRSLQDTTDDEITIGRQTPQDWSSWQRFEDYYNEGALIWLDVDTRIRTLSGGQRSLDDFARAFFGKDPGRTAPLLYDFDEVVRELARVQPFDWAGYLRTQLDAVDGAAPLQGLARAGWRLAWSDKPSDVSKVYDTVFESADFSFSLGLRVGKRGKITDVVWSGPAFRAGLARGPTLLAVNLREYKAETLAAAITAAKNGGEPVELLVKDEDDYRIVRIDYRGGLRYPQLERIEGTPDLLTPILSAR
jgi:predicted metalloprotease with PDZ domain